MRTMADVFMGRVDWPEHPLEGKMPKGCPVLVDAVKQATARRIPYVAVTAARTLGREALTVLEQHSPDKIEYLALHQEAVREAGWFEKEENGHS